MIFKMAWILLLVLFNFKLTNSFEAIATFEKMFLLYVAAILVVNLFIYTLGLFIAGVFIFLDEL